MKTWIAFREPSKKGELKFYKWNESKKWYLSVEEPEFGHSQETVEKYPHMYLFGDSKEDIEKQIQLREYVAKYGDGSAGDVQCPECGRWHAIQGYMDYNDGYYAAGINEDFFDRIICLCGQAFLAKISEVKILWKTEKLK